MDNDKELNELLLGVDEFAARMKARLTEKHKAGYTGWKEHSQEHLEYRIREASTEISLNPPKDVDVANLCAIHYLNRKK